MYEVDRKDKVVLLTDVPQSSVGAPIPLLLSAEGSTVLAYYVQDTPAGWDGSTIRIVDPISSDETIAMIKFKNCQATLFGPPNDETFSSHPLAARGLHPYGAFRIEDSSWLRQMVLMNSVHPHYDPAQSTQLHHFVWAFHDSTFECICSDFSTRHSKGSINSVIPEMASLLYLDS